MSRIAVIVILAITAALAVTAAIVLRTPPKAVTASGPLLNIAPESITAVTNTDRGGATSRKLTRTGPGHWRFSSKFPDGSELSHPADDDRVIAALQSLTRATHAGPAEAPASVMRVLTIETETGGPITIRIGASALAGRVPVEIESGGKRESFLAPSGPLLLLASESMHLVSPKVLEWPAEPTAISLTRGTQTLTFERAGRAWTMTTSAPDPSAGAPSAAPVAADRAAVGQLQAALSSLRAAGPLMRLPSELKAPTTVVRVTTNAAGTPRVQTLSLYARDVAHVSDELGEVVLALDKPELSPLAREAASFLGKESVSQPAADVMAVSVFRNADALAAMKTFRRAERAWATGSPPEPVPATDAAALAAFLTLACETPAAVAQTSVPADFEEIASVKLVGSGDTAIATLSVGLATPPTAAAAGRERRVLTIVNGTVARLYAIEADHAIFAWLKASAP